MWAGLGERGFEGLEIGVHVADDEIFHKLSASSDARPDRRREAEDINSARPATPDPIADAKPRLEIHPFEQSSHYFRYRARGIDAHVRMRICELTPRVQGLHLRAIRCQRPPAVGRHALDHVLERQIEPCYGTIRQHQSPIVRLDERSATRRDNDVPQRQELAQCHSFQLPKVWLSLLRENRRHVPVLPRLDALVDILDAPAGASAKCPGNRCLARSHEADKIQLVGFHARSDSRTEKNSG